MNKLILLIISILSVNNVSYAFNIETLSSLPSAQNNNYTVKMLSDKNLHTAWCANEDSKKTILKLSMIKPSQKKIIIINGYAKNKKTYYNNSRAKKLVISTKSKTFEVLLKDSPLFQTVDIESTDYASLNITEYYHGSKYRDLCISELVFENELVSTMENIANVINLNKNLTNKEVSNIIGELYKRNSLQLKKVLEYLPFDENGNTLRFLLNLFYYCNKYETTIDAELLEQISEIVQGYFNNNSDSIITVLKDNNQLGRRTIISSYYNYIQNSKVTNTEIVKLIKMYDRSLPYDPWDDK